MKDAVATKGKLNLRYLDRLKEKVLIYDGAMGTNIQKRNPTLDDYWGKENCSEVLVLSRYQEMKYEQIAELLGCEVGTVKVRVHRAIRELREVFFKLSGEKASWNAKKSETSLRII